MPESLLAVLQILSVVASAVFIVSINVAMLKHQRQDLIRIEKTQEGTTHLLQKVIKEFEGRVSSLEAKVSSVEGQK